MTKASADGMTTGVEPWWPAVLRFTLVFFAFQVLYAWSEGTAVERFLIESVTVRSAVLLIAHIDPASAVLAIGHEIIAPCGSLSILNGCDGIEAALLLVAAFIAVPMSIGCRLLGILAALAFVYLINQVRVVVLFFVFCRARDIFPLLHGYVAPTSIIIACCVFFLVWLNWCQARIPRD